MMERWERDEHALVLFSRMLSRRPVWVNSEAGQRAYVQMIGLDDVGEVIVYDQDGQDRRAEDYLLEPPESVPAALPVRLYINRLAHVRPAGIYTGLEVRHFAHPPIGDDYDLYVAGADGRDILVRDGDPVTIGAGTQFFTAPRIISAGSGR